MSTLQLFTDVSNRLIFFFFFFFFFFLVDLHVIPFENMYNFSDPNEALSHWTDLFHDVINKNAPPPPPKKKKKKKEEAGETANPSTIAEH